MAGWADGDPLGVRIRAAFGADLSAAPASWTWTDITSYWYASAPIDLEWGRQPGAERAEPSICALTLRNTDGRFTSGNSMSPYWPHVRKWAVPLELDVDLGDGAGWRNKHSGTVRSWPATWPGRSGKLAVARIESVGILGRLGRGTPPSLSPLRRTLAASGPVAYWPGEDDSASTQLASAIDGHPGMAVTGTAEFVPIADYTASTVSIKYGSKALVNLAGGARLSATVPSDVTAATSTVWTVHVRADVDPAVISADFVIVEWETPGGTYVRWRLVMTTLDTKVIGYSSSGAATTLLTGGLPVGLGPYSISAAQNGGNIDITYRADADYTTSVAGTLTGVARWGANTTGTTASSQVMVGHFAIWANASEPPSRTDTATDEYGQQILDVGLSAVLEPAHARLARLAAEDGVSITIPSVAQSYAIRMGWQKPGAALDLYQQCETVDLGLIYESGHGLAYLPRSSRYNQTPALTIDAATRQLGGDLNPVDDDQRYRDRWTVSREDGSSATAGAGNVEGSTQVSLSSDTTLPYHASWRLWLYAGPGARYPQISMPLHTQAGRSLAAAWMACHPGSRVQVVNAPAAAPGSTIDQVIVGARETILGRRSWKVVMATEPADRWDVAVADGAFRSGADGSTLAADLTSSGAVLSLASTTENGVWTTDLSHYPMDLRIGGYQGTGGERATAGAPGQVLNDNPWISGSTAGWASSNSTIAYSTAQTIHGYGSILVTPTGGPTNAGVRDAEHVAVTGGASYLAGLWAYSPTGWAGGIGPAVDWYDAGDVFLSTSIPTVTAMSAGVWTLLAATVTAPAGAAKAAIRGRQAGSPTSSDTWYATGIVLIPVSSFSASPQTLTISQRGVTAPARAWSTGAGVDVWARGITAL